jgi:hypothetical protein
MPARQKTRPVDRWLAVAMLAEAATTFIASYLHRDGRIPLGFTVIRGERFPGASTPELIIGIVLTLGAVFLLTAPPWGRRVAIGATGFAIFGFLLGSAIVLTSSRPSIDLAYHATLLAALIATFAFLLAQRPAGSP